LLRRHIGDQFPHRLALNLGAEVPNRIDDRRRREMNRTLLRKLEGTSGAAIAKMGVNLNYPEGEPDTLEMARVDSEWSAVPLRGSWFLEAFEGPMSNLQRFVAGEDPKLVSSVEDAIRTMAVVEACYESSVSGATPIQSID
jgi:predicted dehydrogenase